MKQNQLIWLALGAGLLYYFSQNKSTATNPSSPDPVPQVPGTSATEAELASERITQQKWRGGSNVAGPRVKVQ